MAWETKKLCDLLYCDICFIEVVWIWTCSIFELCLYLLMSSSHWCYYRLSIHHSLKNILNETALVHQFCCFCGFPVFLKHWCLCVQLRYHNTILGSTNNGLTEKSRKPYTVFIYQISKLRSICIVEETDDQQYMLCFSSLNMLFYVWVIPTELWTRQASKLLLIIFSRYRLDHIKSIFSGYYSIYSYPLLM